MFADARSGGYLLSLLLDRRSRDDHSYDWFQCGVSGLQESQFQRLGAHILPVHMKTKSLRFLIQDLGGQTSIRPYWRCYYANTAAVIFVVDSTDIERLHTASEELSAMLNEDELKDAGLLVFANKQDQPGAKGAGEISEALQLGELRMKGWTGWW